MVADQSQTASAWPHVLTQADRERGAQTRAEQLRNSEERRVARVQDVAFDLAMNASEPTERLAAMRAFDVLCERKRILKMKPLPGSLKPDDDPKSKRKRESSKSSMLARADVQHIEQVQVEPPGTLGVPDLP